MNDFREFQGKSLDEAIHDACVYYDAPREKLEIDIIQDAKTGIFSFLGGGIGARKAIIHARRASVKSSVGTLLGRKERETSHKITDAEHKNTQHKAAPKPLQNKTAVSVQSAMPPAEPAYADSGKSKAHPAPDTEHAEVNTAKPVVPNAGDIKPQPSSITAPPVSAEATYTEIDAEDDEDEDCEQGLRPFSPGLALDQLDQTELTTCVSEVAGKIIAGILGETPVEVHILEHRVDVHADCGDASGLLIGREGQTLLALQYLISRIVSRRMGALVKVQFNAGNYRERQDEHLRTLALALADRVRNSGHSCSTRPMSSYHRRIIHMTLQDQPDIITRSSGEGSLKRIIIQRRRSEPQNR